MDNNAQPTVLSMMVLGKDPQRHIPCDYIQFLRIDGNVLTDPIRDQKEVNGTLIDILRRLDEILVFTCKNKLNIVNSVLFLIKGVYNGKKSANTLLFRE